MTSGLGSVGVGGEAMEAEGLKSLFPMSDIAVMGILPVIARLPTVLKRIRQTATRTERNTARKSRMRTFVKKVETAIASGDKAAAADALRAAQPEMQRAAGKGVTHHNTVARKLSRLSARVKAIATA